MKWGLISLNLMQSICWLAVVSVIGISKALVTVGSEMHSVCNPAQIGLLGFAAFSVCHLHWQYCHVLWD